MSTNISKKKRDNLLDKIKQIRAFIAAAPQDENTGNLLSYLSDLEKDVNGKKYGLVFEEHREEIDEVLDTHTPVLTEDADLFIDHGGQMNFLLEGDNLAALKLLEKTHRGKIDLIYIDPPYNLGEDFIYSDHYVGREDSFKHSKWLSFMSSRLRIAYRLLASKGAIFISINDAEYAGLKMLCDSMWGDENYQATLIWKSRQRADSRNISMLSTDHEYILVYGKSSSFRLLGKDKDKTKYRNPDNDPRGPWASIDLSGLADASRRPNLHFDIIDPKTGNVYPPNPNRGWSKSKETIEKMIAENRILWPSSPKGRPREKKFLSSLLSDKTGFSSVLDPEEVGYTTDGTRALIDVLGNKVFNFPKSVKLIKAIVHQYPDTDCTILDFFAGSGTTGHAVMKLNEEDGGSRRFILCTNDENGICRDVTYERIRRVIDKEDYAASLKYYKIDYVPISDRMYYEYADELLRHIRELVELENGISFTGNSEIAIVLTDAELADFMANIGAYGKCRKLYMGHDLLPDEEQEQSLVEHGIEINIIPDYYYQDLQEV